MGVTVNSQLIVVWNLYAFVSRKYMLGSYYRSKYYKKDILNNKNLKTILNRF